MEPISKFVAWQICNEIWLEGQDNPFTSSGLRCWICSTLKGGPADRLVSDQPGYRGCVLVNRRYDKQHGPSPLPKGAQEPSHYPII